jgi:hypothetical protein
MNSVTHTEPRSSISSSPKHCRNWPTCRRLVTRHRCHFVKQRLRLATQTTIELVRIERNGECKVAPKSSGMQHLLKSGTVGAAEGARTSTKDSPATARTKQNEICCYRLEASLLADCSGGNSRLSYLLWCGGRSFFDQEVGSPDLELHYGIEPTVRFPWLYYWRPGLWGDGGSDF